MQMLHRSNHSWKPVFIAFLLSVKLAALSPGQDQPALPYFDWEIIFEEDFENSPLSPDWKIGEEPQSRVRIDHIDGSSRLVLDDSKNDSQSSQTRASIDFEITGIEYLRIAFDARHFSDEYQDPGTGLDALELFIDGYSIHLDRLHFLLPQDSSSLAYSQVITVPNGFHEVGDTHTLTLSFLQYGSQSTPADGWAFDNIEIHGTKRRELTATLASEVLEDSGKTELQLAITPAPTWDLSLQIVDEANTPIGDVSFQAGQTNATFPIPIQDDTLLNGDRTLNGSVVWKDIRSIPWSVLILDNELATLTLEVPDEIREGFDSHAPDSKLKISPAPDVDLAIRLLSDPSGQLMSPSIPIQAGVTELPFVLSANNDPFADGDRTIQLKAALGRNESATHTVKIIEDDRLSLGWNSNDANYVEGDAGQVALVYFGGAAFREQKKILITVEPEGIIEVTPRELTVEPGQIYAPEVLISALDNSVPNPDRLVIVTARLEDDSLPPGEKRITIRDNDVAGYRIQCGPFLNSDGTAELRIQAISFDGSTALDFSGSVDLYLVGPDLQAVSWTTLPQVNLTNGQVTRQLGQIQELAGKRILAKDSLGRSGQSSHPFSLFEIEPLQLQVATTHPSSPFIYGYVQTDYLAGNLITPRDLSKHLVEIDSTNMQVRRSLLIGEGNPSLSIDHANRYLYASIPGEALKIDLETLTITKRIEIRNANDEPIDRITLNAYDGESGEFIATHYSTEKKLNKVLHFKNDTLYAETEEPHTVAFGKDKQAALFTYKSTSNGTENNSITELRKYKIDDQDSTLQLEHETSLLGYVPSFAPGKDWLLLPRGEAIRTSDLQLVHRLDIPDFWAPSYQKPNMRSLVIDKRNEAIGTHGKYIASFDLTSGTRAFDGALEGLPGPIYSIQNVGGQALLLSFASQKFAVLRSDALLPKENIHDLSIDLSSSVGELPYNTPFTCEVSITNNGSVPMGPLTIKNSLSENIPIETIATDSDVSWRQAINSEGALEISIDEIPADQTVRFLLTLTAPQRRALRIQAALRSPNGDSNPSNNFASLFLEPSFDPLDNQWQAIATSGNALAFSEAKQLILVGTRENVSTLWDRSLIGIETSTGRIAGSIFLGGIPISIETDPTGNFAYIICQNQLIIRKVNLTNWTMDDFFPVPMDQTSSVPNQVVPLSNDRFLYTHFYQGTRLYDEATRKATTTPYNDVLNLVPSTQADVFFGSTSAGIQKLTVESSSFTVDTLADSNSTANPHDALASADDVVFMLNGSTFDTKTLTSPAAFPSEKVQNHISDYRGTVRLAIDAENQRAFANSAQSIHSFDLATRAYLRSLTPSPAHGEILTFRRFDAQGFALLFSDSTVKIIHSDLVPTGEPSSLDLTVDSPYLHQNKSSATLTGAVASPSGTPSLILNDRPVSIMQDEHRWAIQLDYLIPGPNALKLTASDGSPDIPNLVKTYVIHNELPGDNDQDGMIDAWENRYLSPAPTEQQRANADPDGDGYDNRAEFLFGTNPLEYDSPLDLSPTPDNQIRVTVKRHQDARTGFHLQKSADGNTWYPTSASFETTNSIPSDTDYQELSAILPISSGNSEPLFRVVPAYTP